MSILKIKNEQGQWVELPVIKGTDGKDGKSGVYVGTEPPTDEDIDVWIDSDGTADDIVTDVQINGASIVSDGVANIPIATKNALGVTIIGEGLTITNNKINVHQAPAPFIKAGANQYNPITPYNQHDSVFFGLAKASGDTTQKASSNAVGVYTDEAKAKIQNMLGVQGEWKLAVEEITTEDSSFLAYDLGDDFSEILVSIYGRWITGLTSPYVVVRIHDGIPSEVYTQTGVIGETNAFYNNNDRGYCLNTKRISDGFYESISSAQHQMTTKVALNTASFGINFGGGLPSSIRYVSIGTYNNAHKYQSGLNVKIFARK